jgi:hypothetical protein
VGWVSTVSAADDCDEFYDMAFAGSATANLITCKWTYNDNDQAEQDFAQLMADVRQCFPRMSAASDMIKRPGMNIWVGWEPSHRQDSMGSGNSQSFQVLPSVTPPEMRVRIHVFVNAMNSRTRGDIGEVKFEVKPDL